MVAPFLKYKPRKEQCTEVHRRPLMQLHEVLKRFWFLGNLAFVSFSKNASFSTIVYGMNSTVVAQLISHKTISSKQSYWLFTIYLLYRND